MERTVPNKLTCKFSGLYLLRGNYFFGHYKLEWFVWEEVALPSSHAPVFHTNPCNFASFQAAIKSSPCGVRD